MREYKEETVNALTPAFPVWILMASAVIGTGIGVNELLSESLGQKNFKNANRAEGNAVALSIIMTCLFILSFEKII